MTERNRVVLVVEHDANTRGRIHSMLRGRSFSVLQAVSVRQAQRVVANHERQIDLVVTNHNLMDHTGRKITDLLQKARPGIAILHYSTYPPLDELQRKDGAGRVRFILAPFRLKPLMANIRRLLEHMPDHRTGG